jgi:hypothetical protein
MSRYRCTPRLHSASAASAHTQAGRACVRQPAHAAAGSAVSVPASAEFWAALRECTAPFRQAYVPGFLQILLSTMARGTWRGVRRRVVNKSPSNQQQAYLVCILHYMPRSTVPALASFLSCCLPIKLSLTGSSHAIVFYSSATLAQCTCISVQRLGRQPKMT